MAPERLIPHRSSGQCAVWQDPSAQTTVVVMQSRAGSGKGLPTFVARQARVTLEGYDTDVDPPVLLPSKSLLLRFRDIPSPIDSSLLEPPLPPRPPLVFEAPVIPPDTADVNPFFPIPTL